MKHIPAFALLALVALGCSNPPKVSTGANSHAELPANASNIRRVPVNQTKTFGSLDITIGEIALERNQVTVGMTINDKGKAPVSFYPNQHSVVMGKIQFDANMLSGDGVSGEFNTGVERRGQITFNSKDQTIDPAAIDQISLQFGDAVCFSPFKTTDVKWVIDLPK